MWGLGLLVIVSLYVMAVRSISKRLNRSQRRMVIIASISIPAVFPFTYYLYPSYYEFVSRCNESDRIEIYQVEKSDVTREYKYEYVQEELVINRLFAWRKFLVHPELGVLAKVTDYRYYPYGNGWAKVFGLSSGTAPHRLCKDKLQLDLDKVFSNPKAPH